VNLIQPDQELLTHKLGKLGDLKIADSILDGTIQTEERISGNKQYEAVKPEVDRLGKKFADAFRDLHSAHLEFDQYVSQLEDAGGNVSALRIRPNGLSHPMDRSSSYFYGLREFIDAGFFSNGDMPRVFK
jgi:hypothetical protein